MKTGLNDSLKSVTESIRADFDALDAARERAILLSREIIRESSVAIKCVHRQEFPRALQQIEQTRGILEQLATSVKGHDDIESAGFVLDAYKEYAEAVLTHALIANGELPSVRQVGVSAASYINGLAECVGELRRHVLDCLRHGEIERSEIVIAAMDEIYYALVSLDYPEAVTQGLRRRTDAARGMIERTRGEVTGALCQERLRLALEKREREVDTEQTSESVDDA